jgi:hypothetical protein
LFLIIFFEPFESDREITGVNLFSTECKTTLCKIELGFDDEAILTRHADIVPSIVPWDGPAFFHPSENNLTL